MFLQPPLFEEKVHLRVREQPLCSTNPLARWVVEILSVVPVNSKKLVPFSKKTILYQSYVKPFVKRSLEKRDSKSVKTIIKVSQIASVFEVKEKKITCKVNFF